MTNDIGLTINDQFYKVWYACTHEKHPGMLEVFGPDIMGRFDPYTGKGFLRLGEWDQPEVREFTESNIGEPFVYPPEFVFAILSLANVKI